MANQGPRRFGEVLACAALVVVIVGLLVATWMPAIVAARQSATDNPPAVPATAPATGPTTTPGQ